MRDYDTPWKEALEKYFESFIALFFPLVHAGVDWSKGYEFLDKEFQKVVRDAKLGRRIADKLVKVYLRDGKEAWLLIHIEIQSWPDPYFEERMFVYYYRIFDRYRVEVVSLAVMTEGSTESEPPFYHTGRWGCELTFRFPVVSMIEYGADWAALEENMNPFAIVVMAHLKANALGKGRERERKEWKMRLIRMLFGRGYARRDILELLRFIDWLLVLPDEFEQELSEEFERMEKENNMPYVTSFERIGIKKGRESGKKLGKKLGTREAYRETTLDVLDGLFGEVPEDIREAVMAIKSAEILKTLHRKAIASKNLDSFREILRESRKS